MLKIISIAENEEWISKIENIISNPEFNITWVANEFKLYEQIQPLKPSIVFLPNSQSYNVYSLCGKISRAFPLTTTVLVFHSEQELDMKSALRAGAGDVIFMSSPIDKIKEDINLAIEKNSNKLFQQQQLKPTKIARVITVCSTKGGIGKTTVVVNLAAAYGKKLKVAVIDLDLQFGDVAMYLDVKPRQTIYDWVKGDKEGKKIDSYMTYYKDGISILAAPLRPEFADVITGDDVRKVIKILKQQFDIVIIDVSSYMNEIGIVALENSDDILLLTYLDLPTLRNSKILIDTLVSLQLDDRIKVVLNRQMKVKGLTMDTLEQVIGKKIFSALPVMEKAMVIAVNEGQPISYSYPRSQVAKNIFKMAETLYNPFNQTDSKDNKAKKHKDFVGGRV
ncbi:AAA family ATPase [Paenisporosarcina sp. TG20]|uniref:AAA family ATPase n=1 Tax=Paenisporosarcina sp. TG20 TaxID=1211706 RepID=UPI0002E0367E|nr:AAA family ATPase [Paenisporosarcina sp. TG20]